MLYDAYEVQRSLLAGASKLAGLGAGWLTNPANPWGYSSMGPVVAASLEVFAHATAPHGKPEFGIDKAHVGRKDVEVHEEILLRKPFGQLKHFYRDRGAELWGPYGFRDAFNQQQDWVANINMGLNQAPMVVMIENYRTGLIWKNYMKNPEIQSAVKRIGFLPD